MPSNALSSLYPWHTLFSGCMLLSSLACSLAAFYSPASNRSNFNFSFIAVHCYYTERKQCHPQDWSHQPSLLFIYPSLPPPTHSLFFSIQSFHSFSLETLHPCCPVTICCSPLYIVLFLSDLFTCLTTSFQKTFVCFSLVALLPNQAGTETYRLLYYLTHTVKMISSSHVPGCPRHVGEINFIFYLLNSYWRDTGCITQLLCLLKWVSEK